MAEKRRRKGRVALAVLVLLLAALAALALWQKNNIAAVVEFMNAGSQEEIEQKLEQNQQAITEVVENTPGVTVRDLTEEEKQALRDGSITAEELTELLTGAQPKEEAPAEQVKPEEKPAEQPKQEKPDQKPEEKPAEQPKPEVVPAESEYQKQLSAVIAKVYVLREKFTIQLDALKDEAATEYYALSGEELSGEEKTAFAKKYALRARELERTCDAEMDAIVAELDKLISENNGDYSVLDTVIESYASEKSLKKAWYMAELKKRGFSV